MNNNEYQNDLIIQNLALLTTYPIGAYQQVWQDNQNLQKELTNLEENNKNLRKRNFEYKDKIDDLQDKIIKDQEPAKKKMKNNYEVNNYKKMRFSYDNDKIIEMLKSIKSISNIINLKDKWKEIRHNHILQRLYNLIPAIEKLNDMIGLETVKKNIFKKIIYYVRNPNNDEYLHTIISGPPGVGKTELSKIYADIFVRLGILKNSTFISVKRDDLVGKYLGQTAPKTRELLDKALGGVIFLDEAYSLGNEEKKDSFSKEAIDMINQYLSEKKNEFMMIIAGYDTELDKCFFSYNPGLKRRFSSYYNIEEYSYNELIDIFKIKISKSKYNNEISEEELTKFFKENHKEFKFFGGDIEKLINEMKYSQSFRTFYDNKDSQTIIYEDLKDAFINFKSHQKKKINKDPPYGMYL